MSRLSRGMLTTLVICAIPTLYWIGFMVWALLNGDELGVEQATLVKTGVLFSVSWLAGSAIFLLTDR